MSSPAGGFATREFARRRVPPAPPSGEKALRIDTFAADGTWNRPSLGAFWSPSGTGDRVQVELWAPGAGGSTAVGGGGGGAYARGNSVDVSGSSTWAVAGLAGAAVNTDAPDATFGSTLVVASGGLSGTNGGTGGLASASTGDTKFDGGNGALGTGTVSGGASAGSEGSASGATPGVPDGWYGAGLATAGGVGNGGGSQAAAQFPGARGLCLVSYDVPATAGYARFRDYALARTTSGTTHNAALPSGVEVGDVLVLLVAVDAAVAITSVTGWTPIYDVDNGVASKGAAYYRVATGSDAAAIVTAATARLNMAVLRIADAGTPEGTAVAGSIANADPPSHAASGGAVNGLWIAACAWDAGGDISAAPAGYTNFVLQGSSGSTGVRLAFAMREANAASEDPGVFASEAEQWVAGTILIPPAP